MKITVNKKAILSCFENTATEQAIKKYLTIPNPKHAEAVKMNRYAGKIPRELFFFAEEETGLACPRGKH